MTVEARFRLEDSAGDAVARATASDAATVTRERDPSESGSVGGSGELTIETGSE